MKAFHPLLTGLLKQHTRRVVYGSTEGGQWTVNGFTCVGFKDRCTAAIREIVMRMVCKVYKHMDQEAVEEILTDRFVDDIESGADKEEEIQQFTGQINPESLQTTGTTTKSSLWHPQETKQRLID